MFHSFKLERLQSTSSQGTLRIALCHEYEQLIQVSAKKKKLNTWVLLYMLHAPLHSKAYYFANLSQIRAIMFFFLLIFKCITCLIRT